MVVKVCKYGFLVIRIIVLQKPVDTDSYSAGDSGADVAKWKAWVRKSIKRQNPYK